MSNVSKPVSRPPAFRRFWKPALAGGAGGSSIFWFEEILAFAVEALSVILIAFLGGLILLFNHLVFKSRMPRREDLQNAQPKEKK